MRNPSATTVRMVSDPLLTTTVVSITSRIEGRGHNIKILVEAWGVGTEYYPGNHIDIGEKLISYMPRPYPQQMESALGVQ